MHLSPGRAEPIFQGEEAADWVPVGCWGLGRGLTSGLWVLQLKMPQNSSSPSVPMACTCPLRSRAGVEMQVRPNRRDGGDLQALLPRNAWLCVGGSKMESTWAVF